MPALQCFPGAVMPGRSGIFPLRYEQDTDGLYNVDDLFFLSKKVAQGTKFPLQFPDTLLFPVIATGLTQL